MKRAFLRTLNRRRALIKQRWRAVLEHAPTRTPLANPELLAYMIDDTLDELLSGSLSDSATPPVRHHDGGEFDPHDAAKALVLSSCRCGLNPYIGFFLAGESALVSVIREIEPIGQMSEHDILAAETQLLFALRVIGHRDVNSFCEVCRIEHPAAASPGVASLPENCPFKSAEQNAAKAMVE